jgi:hypothetical protein
VFGGKNERMKEIQYPFLHQQVLPGLHNFKQGRFPFAHFPLCHSGVPNFTSSILVQIKNRGHITYLSHMALFINIAVINNFTSSIPVQIKNRGHITYLSHKALFINIAVIDNSWYWHYPKLHALLVVGL